MGQDGCRTNAVSLQFDPAGSFKKNSFAGNKYGIQSRRNMHKKRNADLR